MTNDMIAKGLRICEAATKGPWWSHEGTVTWGKPVHGVREHMLCRIEHSEHKAMFCPQDVRDGRFIAYARTALPKALAENATWTREFDKLQQAYLKLLETGRAWVADHEMGVCDADDVCDDPGCALIALLANATPVAPPFAETTKE